jgi:hypothetical protein
LTGAQKKVLLEKQKGMFPGHKRVTDKGYCQSSKQGGLHPLLLTEPYVNLSIHTALQDDVGN